MIEQLFQYVVEAGRSLDEMSDGPALLVMVVAVSPLAIAVPILLKLREACGWLELPQDRIDQLVYQVVKSCWGFCAFGLGLALVMVWFVALLLFRIVTAVEVGSLSHPGVGRGMNAGFLLTFVPPVGIACSAWGLLALFRTRRHMKTSRRVAS